MASGAKNSQAKLTEADVRAIRLLHEHKIYTVAEIMHRWQISKESAYNIIGRRSWKHVK